MPARPSSTRHARLRAAGAAGTAAAVALGLTAGFVSVASATPGSPAAPSTSPTTSSGSASTATATSSPRPTTSGTPTPSTSTTAKPSSTATATGTTATPTATPEPTETPLPKPRTLVTATMTWPTGVPGAPGDGTRVGVGILPVLRFSADITDQALVEQQTTVTARRTKVKGAWAWVDSRTAIFRPKGFWPGRSKIRVEVDLANQVLGKSGKRWLVGDPSLTTTFSFSTARSWIARINAGTTRMRIEIDGEVAKDFGVSLGKEGWESRSGLKVYYGVKEATHTYTSESLGLEDEEYELVAPWNVRLTPTGEFIHTAKWAYARIGAYNGSHGCTNMFESDAKWIYDRVIPGDVFKYVGTSKPMETTNGPLAMWNIPWREWKLKSALH